MKISVVIPVYNEEKYIETCLKAIVDQTVPADEIIIVDNNCTDNTITIAKKFPVKIIKERRQGMIQARNRGFDAAKFGLISRTDADSIIPKDWLQKIRKNFREEEIDALTGPIIFYDLPFKSDLPAVSFLKLMKFVQRGSTLIGPNMALTKKIWRKVRNKVCLDDKKVHEDIDLALNILLAKGRIKYDYSLVVKISGRRIKNNPASYFIEYPIRTIKTIQKYKKIV